jgi:hypothetical protein
MLPVRGLLLAVSWARYPGWLALIVLFVCACPDRARAAAPPACPAKQQMVQMGIMLARVQGGLACRQVKQFVGILGSPRDTRVFQGLLQQMQRAGLAKVLASPRLVTMSGTPEGHGRVGVQFEEFSTRLTFLPVVLGDG